MNDNSSLQLAQSTTSSAKTPRLTSPTPCITTAAGGSTMKQAPNQQRLELYNSLFGQGKDRICDKTGLPLTQSFNYSLQTFLYQRDNNWVLAMIEIDGLNDINTKFEYQIENRKVYQVGTVIKNFCENDPRKLKGFKCDFVDVIDGKEFKRELFSMIMYCHPNINKSEKYIRKLIFKIKQQTNKSVFIGIAKMNDWETFEEWKIRAIKNLENAKNFDSTETETKETKETTITATDNGAFYSDIDVKYINPNVDTTDTGESKQKEKQQQEPQKRLGSKEEFDAKMKSIANKEDYDWTVAIIDIDDFDAFVFSNNNNKDVTGKELDKIEQEMYHLFNIYGNDNKRNEMKYFGYKLSDAGHFGMILYDSKDRNKCYVAAHEIIETLKEEISVKCKFTVSIGASRPKEDDLGMSDDWLERINNNLKKAKQNGKNQVCFGVTNMDNIINDDEVESKENANMQDSQTTDDTIEMKSLDVISKYGFAAVVALKNIKIYANNGKLVSGKDIGVECDFDPIQSSVQNFSFDVTYKELFLQTVAFINENNKNTPWLKYPKLYLMSKKPKCNYKQGCKQCYDDLSINNQNGLILCATKRRQLADALYDSGQEQKCMTDSLTKTTAKLYLNDKTLIEQSNEYKLQSNWFAQVYSFLKWQQEAIKATLHKLGFKSTDINNYENKQELRSIQDKLIKPTSKIVIVDDIKDGNESENDNDEKSFEYATIANTQRNEYGHLQQFDLSLLLHSYLDELIEYLVIYYCCFDSKLWIPVFYPFIEVAIGTRNCTMLFAESISNTHSKMLTSLCNTGVDIESKQNVLKEMRSISMFKLLLYNVCEANDGDITDVFDLTHKIGIKLEENTNNIKTQCLIQQLADANIIHVDDSKMQENIFLNQNRMDDWIIDGKTDDTINERVDVPNFIRLFIIRRIIEKYITLYNGISMPKLERLLQSQFKNKSKAISNARKILKQLIQDGIKTYMEKWYEESQQMQIIEDIFNKVIMQRFVKEYHKETTYAVGSNTSQTKNKLRHDILVFNINDLMCNIFQHLDYGRYFNGDLLNCSLVCSVWLYHVWNLNSLYFVDISELVNDKLPARTWQRLYNAKFIQCGPKVWIENSETSHTRKVVNELSMLSMITNVRFFLDTQSMIILKTIMSNRKESIDSCDIRINSSKVDELSPLKLMNAREIVIRDLYFYRIWSSNCQILRIHNIDKQWCYFVIKNCDCSGVVELQLSTSFGDSFNVNGIYVLTMLASKLKNLQKLYVRHNNYASKEHVMVFTNALKSNVRIVNIGYDHHNNKSNRTSMFKDEGLMFKDEELQLIGNKYRKLEDLGVGGYSRIILAADRDNGMLVAVRILLSEPTQEKNAQGQTTNIKWEISNSKYRQCKRELELMRSIEHENVVKLIDFMDDATFPQKTNDDQKTVETPCLCVVLEYCSKGELFDYLMYAGGLGSRVTRTYFHQILNGLQAMHNAGYVHRDLKPENLLLDDNYNLKIADFGFATKYKDNKEKILLASACGTRGYLAPELIKGEKYTHMVDLFAVGIIMFTTLAGFPPCQHAGRGDWWWDKMEKAWGYWQAAAQLNGDADKPKKAEKIAKGNQKMKLFWSAHERTCKFSDSFKHLMQYLLNPNPKLRYDIQECFDHPWLKGKTLNGKQLKKTMKKHSEKVNKQRAKKIKEQLDTRGYEPIQQNKGIKR